MTTHDDDIERAWALLDEGDAPGARRIARARLAGDPSDPEALLLEGHAAADEGDRAAALGALERALAAEPRLIDARVALADLLFESCGFDASRVQMTRLLREAPEDARVRWLAALHAERADDLALADREERAAHRLDPDAFPLPPRLTRERFDAVVAAAMQELPAAFRERLENLAVMVDPVPADHLLDEFDDPSPDLLGLYVGVPATERSVEMPAAAPDAIYLFQRNLERASADEEELRREIRTTLLHEIGHYLGMDEDDLAEAGYD